MNQDRQHQRTQYFSVEHNIDIVLINQVVWAYGRYHLEITQGGVVIKQRTIIIDRPLINTESFCWCPMCLWHPEYQVHSRNGIIRPESPINVTDTITDSTESTDSDQ